MNENSSRRRGQVPGRFVPSHVVRNAVRVTKSVRETPLRRFDRKDTMERDLEKYRAEARARLLKNGFDIPPFLMPKPDVEAGDQDQNPDQDMVAEPTEDLRASGISGPKPAAPLSGAQITNGMSPDAPTGPKAKPRRYVQSQQTAGGQALSPQATEDHAAAQNAAIAEERSAYEEYVASLNGGNTLLDSLEGNDSHAERAENDISGRVDDLKETEKRNTRVNLPDNETNWAARDDAAAQRKALLQKQEKARRGSSKGRKKQRPKSLNKMIASMAAYMIAAVAIGHILVLTLNEFSAIIGR